MSAFSWPLARVDGGFRVGRSPRQAESLAASTFLPQGAYTTLRSVGGTGLLRWPQHLARLEETTRLMDYPQTIDGVALRTLLCYLLTQLPWAGEQESRVRITLPIEDETMLWLSAEPLSTPDEADYRDGVAVLVRPMARRNPRAKDSAFIEESQALRALRGGRINEVLMFSPEGKVLEGIDSNVFALLEGRLWTAEEGILPGVTRSLVLEEAAEAGVPLVRDALPQSDLPRVTELFISSTSRGVLPVTEVEGRAVGDGRPGPVTRQLMARYEDRLRVETTEMCADSPRPAQG